ncbi:DUF6221 family protein [Nocardia cyriacigeorgica]|uniref:DUF6221 family protein n=1 Tax=Nocardia cyriacigeorgica TaxID=135487 RepID=UPI0018963A95|nr:DUF6221 family protein [Nocardia cyriacigeorgica]MBF6289301.1 hypothetical protein [Nocardia cyriacigeorgica]
MRIEQFIAARLAEDEQIARESDTGDGEWFYDDRFDRVETSDENLYTLHHSEHIARHDPARVLRQCAAVRELLNVASDVDAMYSIAAEDAADGIRRTIAAIWSDHRDYQQQWADTVP